VVADEVQQRVHERSAPLVADDARTEDDVAELARHAVRHRAEPIDREGASVGRLVNSQVLPLQRAALVRPDEGESQLARRHALSREHRLHELDRSGLVHRPARAVDEFDLDHRLRRVPVCSAWALYASTIRCTSLWRTTSWWLNSTK